ncbi:MAG: glycosyltransferase family 4 protein [Verrucomicrobiota bacterium]
MESRRTLRIALIAPLWVNIPPGTYGGIELLIKLLADELVRLGHQVTLFATGEARTAAKLHPVCPEPIIEMMSKGAASNYEYYANACVVDALAAAQEFDILHFHIGNQWIPMGALSEKPVLFTLHTQPGGDDEWLIDRYPKVPLAAISECQARSIASRHPRTIPVVYNGCDFSGFDPSFAPGKYLAFLGRMSYDKNPLGAIQIARKAGMPLVLAGIPQSAKEERYFEQEIKPLIDGENVRYIGAVDHARKSSLLREASALLFPVQWEEPFGLVMIESMACGTPVIGHALGSIPEVVDEGITGFYSDSIETMHELVPRALALDRARVRRHALERFSYQRMVEDYLRLYESLTDAR